MAQKKIAQKKPTPQAGAGNRGAAAPGRRYWLFKSEPTTYGFAQFERDGTTEWSGVRNHQARNLLRDEIRVGDGVLFYHSSADPTAIVGLARVVGAGRPDPTAFDPKSPYHDPRSEPADPTWYLVDIACVAGFAEPLTRDRLRAEPELADMMLLRRGSRLSVQPVTAGQWRVILRLAGAVESW